MHRIDKKAGSWVAPKVLIFFMFKSAFRVCENTFVCHFLSAQNEHPHKMGYD